MNPDSSQISIDRTTEMLLAWHNNSQLSGLTFIWKTPDKAGFPR